MYMRICILNIITNYSVSRSGGGDSQINRLCGKSDIRMHGTRGGKEEKRFGSFVGSSTKGLCYLPEESHDAAVRQLLVMMLLLPRDSRRDYILYIRDICFWLATSRTRTHFQGLYDDNNSNNNNTHSL